MNLFNKKKSIALAISLSLAVVVSGAYVAQAETIPSLTSQVATITSEISSGFNATFGDIPSRIAERLDNARINSRAKSENVAVYVAPDISSVRMVVEKMKVSYPASALVVSSRVHKNDSAVSIKDSFASAYIALGENVYSAITSFLSGYSSFIEKSGEKVLAAASALSVDDQTKPSVYESVLGFFGSTSRAFTNFFSSAPSVETPVVVDVTEPPEQSATTVTNTPPSQTAKPQPTNSNSNTQRVVNNNSYPTYTTVIQGVSPDFMEKSLASLKADILASVNNTVRPIYAQNAQNAQTIQMVSRIEDLSNLIVRNGDFRNSIFDNGVRVSATGGNFTTLTGGTTSLGATTVTGALSLTGSTTLQNFTFANATGTNATTTNFFATTASSTNLFTSNFSIASLSGFLKATAGSVAAALINLASDVTGVLPVLNGGTGWAAISSGAIPYGNGSSALATTTAGTSGYVLALNGSTPTWVATTTFSSGLTYANGNVTNTGVLSLGPTGSALTGALVIATSSTAFNGLTASTTVTGSGTTLTFANTLAGLLGVGGGGTGLSSVSDGQLLFGSGGTALTALATTSLAGRFLTMDYSTGRPSWVATTSLGVAISDTTGTLQIARGGTGQTSFTADQLHYGDFATVATTTFTPSAEFTVGGTLGAFVGGANSTLTLATNGVALTKLAQIAANSILGNTTGAAGNVTAIATSSLFTWTGTGDIVRATSPTLITPALGTPSALVLTNATGLPVAGGGTGLSSVGDGQLLFGSGGTALTALATSTGGLLTNSYTTGRPAWTATSTMFGTGTGGQVLGWSNTLGGLAFIATSSSASAITALGSGFASTTGATITFSTTTLAFNGLTFGQTIVPSADALMFTPTVTGTLSVGGGGTGASTLTGLLQGNGAGAITAVTGTVGQFAYFNGTNTLTATSSIYLATTQNVGIGTTTPLSKLTISGSASIGADYNIAAPTNGLIVQGNLGVGTTSPWLALSVTNTSASGQFVASYDNGNYATLAVDAVGDLKFTAKGGDIRALSENLWVCDNAGCPTLTATSTAGNIFVENAITFGNGFSMASTSNVAASELGLYGAGGGLIVIFDNGL